MSTIFDEVVVRINAADETIRVEEHLDGGVSVKEILPADFLKILTNSAMENHCIDTGFLPEGCLSVKIYDKKKQVVLWNSALHADVTYFNTLYERFPLPRMVFAFGIDPDGKTSSYRLAVVADEKPTPKTVMYEYPFSNVYSHTGICIGAANSMPLHKSLRSLAALPNHILGLPNNDHNFSRANNRLNLGYRDLMEHLKDKPPAYYYERVLVPRSFTLQDFIDNKIR
ncbi:MAG: prokaryotic E2 ligase family D protein [Oscillospiraceae bacterium]|jgi:hypothetical protein|nr:prokaryotic E2 ligase family D protein [Oscillospiraceae bacterium]